MANVGGLAGLHLHRLDAYIGVLETPGARGEILNLAGSEITIAELAKVIAQIGCELTGIKVPVEFAPARQEAESRDLKVSTRRAREILDFRPEADLRRGLRETVAYVRDLVGASNSTVS